MQSTVDKDKVMEIITELTTAGKSIQDIEDYQQFNRFLESQDVSIESLTKYYYEGITRKMDLPGFIRLYDELISSERSLEQFISDLDLEKKLLSKDLSIENMSLIHQIATRYGGFKNTMHALDKYNELGQLNNLNMQAQMNLNQIKQRNQRLVNQNTQLDNQNKVLGAYAITAQGLMTYGYDLASLLALKKLAEKYGGPVALFDSIAEYEGIEAIRQLKANLTETNHKLEEKRITNEAELAAQEAFIERANKMIGAIDANQGKAVAAQLVYELMTDPENIDIESSRLKRVFLHFLLGVRQYGERNREKINGWKDIETTLKWLVEGLTKIT